MNSSPRDEATLLLDARAIATHWYQEMDLSRLVGERLDESKLGDVSVDIVAIGKASREMTEAVARSLNGGVRRRIIVCDAQSAARGDVSDVVVAEHPVPGEGSLRAGSAVLEFLDRPTSADATLFLVSGGASSLCVVPAAPLSLDDLHEVWRAVLRTGVDITTLNQIRAASSVLSGGAILRHVQTPRSTSLVLVDNVVSGAQWVASAMTYDYQPSLDEVTALWERIGVEGGPLRDRLVQGFATRERVMAIEPTTRHENVVVGEPAMMLSFARNEARARGYQVIDLGAEISGDVSDVTTEWAQVISEAPRGPVAIIGVGEVTVKVRGGGEGGRCQEMAWLMAEVLERSDRDAAFVALASDGRDNIAGVAGAWVDGSTSERARERSISWEGVVEAHNTYPALRALGQLIDGGHTGWNLCDLYVAVLG